MSDLKRKLLSLDACLVLILILCTFLVYFGVLDNNFLVNWDDELYVTANPDIQSINLGNLKKIFTNYYVGMYAPLQMLSYMFDFAIWGLEPSGFLLHNLCLHSLNGGLLYLLLRSLQASPLAALLGALLFLVHPVQVESVAWVSQRKNLLAMFFFLISLNAYHRYVVNKALNKTFFWVAGITFLCALLSKTVAVVLPVVLVAYDVLLRPLDRRWIRCAAEKIPFLLLAALFAWIAVESQSTTLERAGGIASDYHGGSAYATFLTMLTVYQKYLLNIVWPSGLSAVYNPDILVTADARILLPIFLLFMTLCAPLLFKNSNRTKAFFWVSVFIVGFVPVMQIVPLITLMNDRYLYFPMLGLCGYLALVIDKLPVPASKIAVFVSGLFLVAMSCLTMARIPVWNNPAALWKDATIKEQGSALAWHALGFAHYNEGHYQKAIKAYQEALRIEPSYPDASYNLAIALILEGSFREAERILLELRRGLPNSYSVTLLLANTYYFQNDFQMAGILYEVVKRMNPKNYDAWNLLSLVELRAGNDSLSSRYWQQALSLGGSEGELFLNRARLESLKRNPVASLAFLEKAISMGFRDVDLLYADRDLAFVRSQSGFNELIRPLVAPAK
jgi:Flp pilus assembly protein TadD